MRLPGVQRVAVVSQVVQPSGVFAGSQVFAVPFHELGFFGQPEEDRVHSGSDEGDDVSGRGWAALNPDGTLEGHIYFHLGDDSAFRAERFNGVVQ